MHVETQDEANYYFDMEVKDELVITEYILDGVTLENQFTALKRMADKQDQQAGWWYSIGVLFKSEQLAIGT